MFFFLTLYIDWCLQNHYPILFRGVNGTCAHEFIVDLRGFKVVVVKKRNLLVTIIFHASRANRNSYHRPLLALKPRMLPSGLWTMDSMVRQCHGQFPVLS